MGLIVLIIIQAVLWLIGFFVNGITLYQVLLIVPVAIFSFRKFGIKISSIHIIVIEVLFIFFSTVFTILFSEIEMPNYAISIILRVISCSIAVIDDTVYVYVTEERKIK